MAKKWLKLKQSRKPHVCGIRGLRVKEETLAQVFSCELCDSYKNTGFTEHLWVTAFVSDNATVKILNFLQTFPVASGISKTKKNFMIGE